MVKTGKSDGFSVVKLADECIAWNADNEKPQFTADQCYKTTVWGPSKGEIQSPSGVRTMYRILKAEVHWCTNAGGYEGCVSNILTSGLTHWESSLPILIFVFLYMVKIDKN